MQVVAGVFTSNSARIRQASIRQNSFQILFQVVGAKVSKLKSKSRIHTDPFDFSAISLSPSISRPHSPFGHQYGGKDTVKNSFYSAVSKAVPIPRRAGKRFELGGILKPQRTEYTPTGTRKYPAATSAIPRRSPPLKTSAAKNQPRPISRCKKPKKVRKSY